MQLGEEKTLFLIFDFFSLPDDFRIELQQELQNVRQLSRISHNND
jgi:hypothetical protein